MVIDGEDAIIRLRDGGPAFNLKHFADRMKEEDNLSEVYHRILIAKVPKKHDRLRYYYLEVHKTRVSFLCMRC